MPGAVTRGTLVDFTETVFLLSVIMIVVGTVLAAVLLVADLCAVRRPICPVLV